MRGFIGCCLGWILACASGPAEEPVPAEAAVEAPPPRAVSGPLVYLEAGGQVSFSRWSPRDGLAVGVDQANLRSAPSVDSEALKTLPLGQLVEIEAVSGETTEVVGRQNQWYRVRAGDTEGYLFGSLLTPVLLQADLDGDATEEEISLLFSPEFRPRVTVREPSLPEEADRVVGLDLDLRVRSTIRGGAVDARAVQSTTYGWSLLEVRLCHEGECVSQLVSYVLDPGSPLGRLTALPGEPSSWSFEGDGLKRNGRRLRRDGSPIPREAKFIAGQPRHYKTFELQSYGRGNNQRVPCTLIGEIEGGRYHGAEVVSCVISWRPYEPTGVEALHVHRFARLSGEWIYLEALSAGMSPIEGQEEDFRKAGFRYTADGDANVSGLNPEHIVDNFPGGRIIREAWLALPWRPEDVELAFVRPLVGPLYRPRPGKDGSNELSRHGDLFSPQPEGVQVFQMTLDGLSLRPEHRGYDCDTSDLKLAALPIDVTGLELQEVGTANNGQVLYSLPAPSPPIRALMEEQDRIGLEANGRPPIHRVWKAPFGLYYLLSARGAVQKCGWTDPTP